MAPSAELKTLQKQLAQLAVSVGRDFDLELDYSHDSLRSVEKILGEFHKDYKKTKNDEVVPGIALEFTAYIIGVIETHTEPGEWRRDHPEYGKDTFPYHWKGHVLFPFVWCIQRIYDGEDKNVWEKYNQLILQHSRPSSI